MLLTWYDFFNDACFSRYRLLYSAFLTSLPLTLHRSRSCAVVLRGERADVTDFFLFSWPWWMGYVVKHNMLKCMKNCASSWLFTRRGTELLPDCERAVSTASASSGRDLWGDQDDQYKTAWEWRWCDLYMLWHMNLNDGGGSKYLAQVIQSSE